MKIPCHELLKFMFWCIDNNGGPEESDELNEMFKEFGFQEGCCMNQKCSHNIFWEKIKKGIGRCHKRIMLNKRTAAEDFGNCMCLLDRELTLDEIGEIYGLSRERIRQIEGAAMAKFAHAAGKKTVSVLTETWGDEKIKKILSETFKALRENKKLKKRGRPWLIHGAIRK